MGPRTRSAEHRTTLVPSVFDLGAAGLLPDVPTVLRALERPAPWAADESRRAIALDSAGGAPGRVSLVAFDPLVRIGGPPTGVSRAGASPADLPALRELLARFELAPDAGLDGLAFRAGFVGALAYELGAFGELLDLPAPVWPVPPIVGGIHGDWIELRHGDAGEVVGATLVLCDAPGGSPGTERPPVGVRHAQLVAALRAALTQPAGRTEHAPSGPAPPSARRATPRAAHIAGIERVREHIARGDIYQANLSHRWTAATELSALELHLAARRVNPAPYMALCPFTFLDGAEGAIVSASPELLVEVTRTADGLVARTRPIKGTIARGASADEDAEQRRALLASQKDLAELAMIVDLERNDLGRIARPGSVEVAGFPTLQSYATVHHLVADVSARVADGFDALDVVASLFPGGSITGAPKLRSMEVIAELEGEGRGFFTGSLGTIDLAGEARLNILIRTMIHRRSEGADSHAEVSFHVGGGITWASDAAAEDDETRHKAEGLLRALSGR